MDNIQFYTFLEEEHKSDPHKIKKRRIFMQTLNNKFRIYFKLPKHLDDCGICLEEMQRLSVVTTKCKHYFHINCLNKWRNTNQQEPCPLCRTQLKIPSFATFTWEIKKQKFVSKRSTEENTHIDFKKKDDDAGNVTYTLDLIVSGGMSSKGTVKYVV